MTTDLALPWLVNRTVLLIGDSVDRFHLRDFCDELSASISPPFHDVSATFFDPSPSTPESPSQSFMIGPQHPLSPPPLRYHSNASLPPSDWPACDATLFVESQKRWDTSSAKRTRPWVCAVPAYNFTLVSIFTFGLDPPLSGRTLAHQPWYHPPSPFTARLHHIARPLLASLAAPYSRPSIASPDLVEIASGFWDLRGWTEEGFAAEGVREPDPASDVPIHGLVR